jgi:general secretion pathway protein G
MRFNDRIRRAPSVCHGRVGRALRSGFSLIEIMIVVVIIGLMAGVVTLATTGYLERAKKERARSDIATYTTALDSYYLQKGKFPDTQEGLKVLVPDFIKAITHDPWGHPYQYLKPGKNSPYDLISYGADGREGGTGADADILASELQQSKSK